MIVCWETLGTDIHVNVILTHTFYLNIAADQVYPFTATVLPDGSNTQQDNASCHRSFNNGLRNMTKSSKRCLV